MRRDLRRVGSTGFGRQGHLDIEVPLHRSDTERHDEEDEQLKHDVNHRCHLDFDLLIADER
jgi:hypothetical protein